MSQHRWQSFERWVRRGDARAPGVNQAAILAEKPKQKKFRKGFAVRSVGSTGQR
jgi:hypothetical protein